MPDKELERNASVIAAALLINADCDWVKADLKRITNISINLVTSIRNEIQMRADDQDMYEVADKATPSVSGRRIAADEDDGALISFRLKKEKGAAPSYPSKFTGGEWGDEPPALET